MDIESKIDDLTKLVSKYNTESLAGFFAYFIRKRPGDFADISLNKFESKLKDFLYLIAINSFSKDEKRQEFEFSDKIVNVLADKVNEIKDYYRITNLTEYTRESVIHEMAFKNYFDNGVLSYVEQDLEKIRTVFKPFEKKIVEDFGFDINFLVEVYKAGELITNIRLKHTYEFSYSKAFKEFNERIQSKKMEFQKSFDLLPENIQNAFLSFHAKPHAYLLFTKNDLYLTFPKEKVDRFLDLFSCEPNPDSKFRYYTDSNPFELAPILKLADNTYLNLYQKQIPIAIYKRLYSHLQQAKQYKDKLGKHRDKSLEKKVVELFKSFFGEREAFFYENYFIEDNHEQDLLIIYKGVAIIVETKASKLREPFRDIQKAVLRLKDDFKNAVQYGYDQCIRVEDYFFDVVSFDVKDAQGKILHQVKPSKIHSVYSIVVTLERFGALQTDLAILLKKENEHSYPWSVYIDDLETFLLALKHHIKNPQGKFLDFLKSRRQMHGHMYAIDELDVCATYIRDPEKFNSWAKTYDILINFSPYEQGIFDEIYHAGRLRFKEKPLPDEFYRYGL